MSDVADHDSRAREYGQDAYFIETKREGEVVGRIVCVRKGVQLIDFYRTSGVLAKDVKPFMGAYVK